MHKIITRKSLRTFVVITMITVLLACLCVNFLLREDISVFSRAVLV